jgi:6,7-dimethyl-8-ribityllumazine synthase
MSNTPDTILNSNNLQVKASQVVVFYTEWNATIVNELVAGAKKILEQYPQINIQYFQVPGCVELSFAVQHYHKYATSKADAYIVFGCVIQGDTKHFDYVCQTTTDGITWCNTHLSAPTIFGVLTVNNLQQAQDRIGGSHGHKGEEAAVSAIRMMQFCNAIK